MADQNVNKQGEGQSGQSQGGQPRQPGQQSGDFNRQAGSTQSGQQPGQQRDQGIGKSEPKNTDVDMDDDDEGTV